MLWSNVHHDPASWWSCAMHRSDYAGLRGDGRRTGLATREGGSEGQRGGPWPCHVTGSGGGRGHGGRTVSPMLRRSLLQYSQSQSRARGWAHLRREGGRFSYGLSFYETRENKCASISRRRARARRPERRRGYMEMRHAFGSRCSQSESHSSYH